jgi:methionyl-tRNA formyltransferase
MHTYIHTYIGSLRPTWELVIKNADAIQNNDLIYGTTLHIMSVNVDEGDIIAERQLIMRPDFTSKILYDAMQILSFEMFKEELPNILNNKTKFLTILK